MRFFWYTGALVFQATDAVRRRGRDRGDVPGWVMVTLMSAILVVAILGVFRGKVLHAINQAIDNVIGAGDN